MEVGKRKIIDKKQCVKKIGKIKNLYKTYIKQMNKQYKNKKIIKIKIKK
jgi:hypothetical protein